MQIRYYKICAVIINIELTLKMLRRFPGVASEDLNYLEIRIEERITGAVIRLRGISLEVEAVLNSISTIRTVD